ncbi:MAG: heme lyase CcmF/NrfE family subunit [Actinomycetota bacterium]
MASGVGRLALTLALALAAYGAGAAVLGARRRHALLVESARTTAYSLLALVAAANAAMLAAILTDDFSIRYVAENSSRATPTFFKVLSLWAADEGSLLLWNLVLAGFVAAVAFRFRRRRPETFPWALATMYGVAAFYLMLVLGPTAPFAELSPVPPDGRGPLPLLQNHPLMAAHPPLLYLGFIGMTVPFAFGVAALATGRLSDEWIRVTRRWTLVAWTALTAGLILGALWSYGVLGWGGYWAWDPVENVALLPWLTATAFLHSVMVEERRGMLKVWNLSLVIGTFALTVLGTFLTRGSILSSVHAFAQSIVGPMYLAFLALVLVGGFGLLAARAPLLASESAFDTPLSREAAFLGNNVLLLVPTFTVLVGTIYPLLAQALSGEKVSVGGPYFTRTTVPVMLLLLFLMGIGPLLPWRAGSARRVASRLRGPAWAGALTVAALALSGMRALAPLLAFGLAAFVVTATVAELGRGVRAHRRASPGPLSRTALAAARRNPRLYGGLVVHLGVVLAAVAVTASSAFDRQAEVTLGRGGVAAFAGHAFRFDGVREVQEPHRRVVVADVSLLQDGRAEKRLTPSLNYYPASADPIGTPAIRYGTPANLFRDLYVSVVALEPDGSRATFRLHLNPGVVWLWVGGAVMLLGGALAAWPSPRRRALPLPDRPARVERDEVMA